MLHSAQWPHLFGPVRQPSQSTDATVMLGALYAARHSAATASSAA
jgi:hypothetical protein